MRDLLTSLLASCIFLSSACSVRHSSVKRSVAEAPPLLKVISYNIHHANPPSKAKEGIIDVEAIANVIIKQQPDLVGLQEVDRNTRRSGGIDEAELLARKTGMHYRFFKAIDHDNGDYGLAILSRYPIVAYEQAALKQAHKAEQRILAYVTVSIPNAGNIIFANTHLDATRPDSNRIVQMKGIIEILEHNEFPVVLVGDLNSEANKEPILLLDQQFKRTCVSDCGFTIPETAPNKTIDYIAVKNADWPVLNHTVITETYASDHRPVMAVFKLK